MISQASLSVSPMSLEYITRKLLRGKIDSLESCWWQHEDYTVYDFYLD